jgi:hypothetical protein
VGVEAQLSAMLNELATEWNVFVRCDRRTRVSIAEHVYELVQVAQEKWADVPDSWPDAPTSAIEVALILHRVSADTAVDVMAELATYELAYSTVLHDPDHARRVARKVVDLLGRGAAWWTNRAQSFDAWDPVTARTFDGVIAGVGDSHSVVLLQVAED